MAIPSKIKIDFKVTLDSRISSVLAFLLIALLSFLVAWYALSASDKIIKNAPNSPVFNIEKRASVDLNN